MKTRNHLIVSHCIVHHLVEVARIIVVHYSHLLHFMDETVDDGINEHDNGEWRKYLFPVHFWRTWISWGNSVRALQAILRITASWLYPCYIMRIKKWLACALIMILGFRQICWTIFLGKPDESERNGPSQRRIEKSQSIGRSWDTS